MKMAAITQKKWKLCNFLFKESAAPFNLGSKSSYTLVLTLHFTQKVRAAIGPAPKLDSHDGTV